MPTLMHDTNDDDFIFISNDNDRDDGNIYDYEHHIDAK